MVDYAKYYNLEEYLFGTVTQRFQRDGTVSAFDFFCIVIWKANRAKSRVAEKLLSHKPHRNLERSVDHLVREIANADSDERKMQILLESWGFGLPMASAILTVLYPKNFTVYDVRVCRELEMADDGQYATSFESRWARYSDYKKRVETTAPETMCLRDKDRYLWGKDFARQLREDIESEFSPAKLRAAL